MKQKPDETLDSWVRQSLRQLPDTIPPDTSFDSERLWTQLRPELQPVPSHRKNSVRWWAAAACLAGLVLSWLVWQHYPTRQLVAATHRHTSGTSIAQVEKAKSMGEIDPAESVIAGKPTKEIRQRPIDRQNNNSKISAHVASVPKPVIQDVVVPSSDSTATAIELRLVSEKPVERNKPNVALAKPKRRFRLMHENELRAEEEAAPKIYRTDHFVRIGTGRSETSATESQSVEPPLSLTTKKSQ